MFAAVWGMARTSFISGAMVPILARSSSEIGMMVDGTFFDSKYGLCFKMETDLRILVARMSFGNEASAGDGTLSTTQDPSVYQRCNNKR